MLEHGENTELYKSWQLFDDDFFKLYKNAYRTPLGLKYF